MADSSLPATMQAQLFDGTSPTMEANLKYTKDAPLPSNAHNLKPNQMLVRVTATSLNPVDYKFASLPIVGRLIVPRPSSPGLDFAGWVASSQPPSPFKYGQQVFGRLNRPQQYGALGEYVVASTTEIVPRPEGLSKEDAASIGTAGLTAYQSIVPYVKPGDRVFINGGSGGVGSFCIQIAKALGCHVTTSCSTGNVQLCKDLGADRVIDYKSEAVVKVFQTSGKYQHVVDNVGTNPELWNGSEVGTDASTQYVQVGAEINLWAVVDSLKKVMLPVRLGGVNRKFAFAACSSKPEEMAQLAQWVVEGKIKIVKDTVLPFESAQEGFVRLRTGRTVGKIVILGAK